MYNWVGPKASKGICAKTKRFHKRKKRKNPSTSGMERKKEQKQSGTSKKKGKFERGRGETT